ncbi:MAG: hypothetical protein WBE68_00190, partial [Candidatus Nitrosopolaris sp.]
DTSREVHEMFKTTAIDTLKQDKKCQACWYMILSTMSGSTTLNEQVIVICRFYVDAKHNFRSVSVNIGKFPLPLNSRLGLLR